MKFFIAGIMQGSKIENSLHSQNYRNEIKSALERTFPNADVYDPLAANQDSIHYSPEDGKNTFLFHNRMCGTEIDVLVAFVPQASMGTAIEIWEAWRSGATVISISPMSTNWVVQFLSDAVYPDLESFGAALSSGEIAKFLASRPAQKTPRTAESDAAFAAISARLAAANAKNR